MRRTASLVAVALLAGCAATPPAPKTIPVFFRSGTSELGPEGQTAVQTAASLARQYPSVRIRLVGYGAPAGAPQDPQRLAGERAEAVAQELVRDGVAAARIQDRNGGVLQTPPDSSVQGRRVDISFVRGIGLVH